MWIVAISPVTAILRLATRKPGEPLNILCAPTHEAYETSLSKTGHNFYAFGHESFKTWNPSFRKVPDNYTILDASKGVAQIPLWLDLDIVLSQNKFGQYQVLSQVARQLHLPMVSLEHTLPFPGWDNNTVQQIRNMRGHVNVFISEYSIGQWNWDCKDDTEIIHHSIDVDTFCPAYNDDFKRKGVILSVVNDWINRDWCKIAGQKILTNIGYIPIEKIVVGNNVLTDCGRFHKVTKTFERDYCGDLVKIWVDKKKDPICFTPEHNIRVYRDGQEKYIESNRLRVGDKLKFPEIQQSEFYPTDTKFAWLIGNIIGDGSISTSGNISICCNLDELEKADKLKNLLHEIVGFSSISERHIANGKNILTVESTSKILGNWLRDKIGTYSKNKKIPDFIFLSSNDNKLAILQGLWSCDGSFKNGNRGYRFVYSTTSVQLASQVSAILHHFGIRCEIRKEKRSTNKSNYIYRIVSDDKDNVDRCKNLIQNGSYYEPYSYTITNLEIETEWNGKVYNCSVENDPSYVVYPGFVAHNCCGFSIWQRVTKDLPVDVWGDTKGLSIAAPSTDALASIYRGSRIFLNTSTISPVPTSLLEAMASGCAIVSTATCMIPHIIKNGVNGFISNDEAELRKYLEMLLEDEGLAKRLGDEARKTVVKHFSEERFVAEWNEIFERTASTAFLG